MHKYYKKLQAYYYHIRFGEVTKHIMATAGDGVPAEIEYRDRKGRVIGFWAYGSWHPKSKYKGG